MKWFKPAFGYLLAGAGLVWVLYDIQYEKLLGYLNNINWWWIAAAVICDVLSYLSQGLRWRLLLQPVARISTLHTTQAIYAGLFTNEVLPMRLGELVRSYLVARWARVKFLSIIPSILVERLIDGVWLAVLFGLTAFFVPLPGMLLKVGDTVGIAVVIATVLFLSLVRFRPIKKGGWNWKPLRMTVSLIDRLADGLRGLGFTRLFYLAFLLSSALLLLQGLAFWLVMVGYGLRLSFWIGIAVFLIVHLGTLIPNAPGNVGSYQFFCVLGLSLFGVEKTQATGFSLVVFILLSLPLLLIGFVALSRSGTTLLSIRQEIDRVYD